MDNVYGRFASFFKKYKLKKAIKTMKELTYIINFIDE